MRAGEVAVDQRTARAIKAGRALLDWSQIDLAQRSKVSVRAIRRLEGFSSSAKAFEDHLRGTGGALYIRHDTIEAIMDCFKRSGLSIEDTDDGMHLTYVDPAGGSGHFLLEAQRQLRKRQD